MLDQRLVQLRAGIHEIIERPNGSLATLWEMVDAGVIEAREAGMAVAQIIIQVKMVWDGVITVHGDATHVSAQRLKQEIVTRIIKAYYMQ